MEKLFGGGMHPEQTGVESKMDNNTFLAISMLHQWDNGLLSQSH